MDKIITQSEIEKIIFLLNERSNLKVKQILKDLPDEDSELKNKLKTLIRNLGKSNMINKTEIEELINEN